MHTPAYSLGQPAWQQQGQQNLAGPTPPLPLAPVNTGGLIPPTFSQQPGLVAPTPFNNQPNFSQPLAYSQPLLSMPFQQQQQPLMLFNQMPLQQQGVPPPLTPLSAPAATGYSGGSTFQHIMASLDERSRSDASRPLVPPQQASSSGMQQQQHQQPPNPHRQQQKPQWQQQKQPQHMQHHQQRHQNQQQPHHQAVQRAIQGLSEVVAGATAGRQTQRTSDSGTQKPGPAAHPILSPSARSSDSGTQQQQQPTPAPKATSPQQASQPAPKAATTSPPGPAALLLLPPSATGSSNGSTQQQQAVPKAPQHQTLFHHQKEPLVQPPERALRPPGPAARPILSPSARSSDSGTQQQPPTPPAPKPAAKATSPPGPAARPILPPSARKSSDGSTQQHQQQQQQPTPPALKPAPKPAPPGPAARPIVPRSKSGSSTQQQQQQPNNGIALGKTAPPLPGPAARLIVPPSQGISTQQQQQQKQEQQPNDSVVDGIPLAFTKSAPGSVVSTFRSTAPEFKPGALKKAAAGSAGQQPAGGKAKIPGAGTAVTDERMWGWEGLMEGEYEDVGDRPLPPPWLQHGDMFPHHAPMLPQFAPAPPPPQFLRSVSLPKNPAGSIPPARKFKHSLSASASSKASAKADSAKAELNAKLANLSKEERRALSAETKLETARERDELHRAIMDLNCNVQVVSSSDPHAMNRELTDIELRVLNRMRQPDGSFEPALPSGVSEQTLDRVLGTMWCDHPPLIAVTKRVAVRTVLLRGGKNLLVGPQNDFCNEQDLLELLKKKGKVKLLNLSRKAIKLGLDKCIPSAYQGDDSFDVQYAVQGLRPGNPRFFRLTPSFLLKFFTQLAIMTCSQQVPQPTLAKPITAPPFRVSRPPPKQSQLAVGPQAAKPAVSMALRVFEPAAAVAVVLQATEPSVALTLQADEAGGGGVAVVLDVSEAAVALSMQTDEPAVAVAFEVTEPALVAAVEVVTQSEAAAAAAESVSQSEAVPAAAAAAATVEASAQPQAAEASAQPQAAAADESAQPKAVSVAIQAVEPAAVSVVLEVTESAAVTVALQVTELAAAAVRLGVTEPTAAAEVEIHPETEPAVRPEANEAAPTAKTAAAAEVMTQPGAVSAAADESAQSLLPAPHQLIVSPITHTD